MGKLQCHEGSKYSTIRPLIILQNAAERGTVNHVTLSTCLFVIGMCAVGDADMSETGSGWSVGNTLEICEVIETGRKLLGQDREPFLKTEVINCELRASGTSPVRMDRSHNSRKGKEILARQEHLPPVQQ